jgi:hypothetical protein
MKLSRLTQTALQERRSRAVGSPRPLRRGPIGGTRARSRSVIQGNVMAKLLGRFRHINKGQVIEDGREIEFRLEMKSGDIVTVQMLVSEVPLVTNYLQNLALKATPDDE